MSKIIKTYEELVPGDKMYSEEGEHFIGTLITKGTASDLSEYDIEDWDMDPKEIDDNFDLVLIQEKMGNFDDSAQWYNYNNDQSGAVSYKEDELRKEIDGIDTKAGDLISNLEDEFGNIPEEPHVQNLLDALNELQAKITEYQEAEGWI